MGIFDKVREKLFQSVDGEAPGKPTSVEDQSNDEKDLVGYIRRKLDEARTNANRIGYEGIWMTNIAYLMGFDGIYYDTRTRSYQPVARSPYLNRNRVHANKILPMAQNRAARLCKVPPRFETIPNSQREEDKEGALLGLDVLVDLWHRQEINRKRLPLTMWMQQCGHAYLKVSYDKMAGEKMVDPITGEFQGYEGEVRVDVVSAFEVFPDPLAQTLEEAAYLIQAKIRPLEYFRSHYERGELVEPEDMWLQSLQYESRINSANGYTAGGGQASGMAKNSAIEISYYERPSMKRPMGRHIIIANGVLLKDDELTVGDFPFAKFDDIQVAGKYNSESCITHARPLQDQYNATLTRRGDWVRKMLAGKYIAARQHGLMKESLNDQNGEVVEYDVVPGAGEPHAMQIPLIPEYAYKETESLENDIAQVFGLSEVSRGIVQPSMPAVGMQLILEQDETRIGIEIEQHEHAYARLGTLCLKFVEKCYKTKRALRKKDSQGNFNVRYYSGEELKGNTACMVIRGSSVPTSRSLRRQDILNTYQLGLLGNPGDPALRMKVMQQLEFGDTAGMWTQFSSTKAQIKKMIDDIEKGVITVENAALSVSQYDDHVLFLMDLNEYRKSDKYESLMPEQKEAFLRVMDAHLEWQARITNPAVAMPPQAPMNLEGALNEAENEQQVAPPPQGAPIAENPPMNEDQPVAQ